MKNATMTEIKHFDNSFEVLNEFWAEVDLDEIFVREFEQELPNDLNSFV